MGTQHLLRILTGLTEGAGAPGDLAQLHRLSEAMRKASLCGLGQTAPNPVLTTLQYFAEEYREHIEDHRCSAGVCRELVEFWIDAEKCNGCTACVRSCPVDSIAGEKKQPHLIDAGQCIRCGACRATCKFGAVLVRPRSIAQNGNFKFSQTVTHHV